MRALLILACSCSTLDIPAESNIADGDTGVEPVKILRIALDPATSAGDVTDDAFTLADSDGFELPVTAVFDDVSTSVELTPIRPLLEGTAYTLTSSTVFDSGGALISIGFTTLDNPIVRQLNLVPGTVTPIDYLETDAEGRELQFVDAGPDLIMPSPDDVLGSYQVIQDRVGDVQLTVTFTAGPDGEFFTPDDQASSYTRSEFDGPLRITRDSFNAGPDGQIETADDTIVQIRDETRNEAGQLTRLDVALDGGDNVPRSADDMVVFSLAIIYDARGLFSYSTGVDAGPDGVLGTPDDVIPDGEPTNFYDERGVYQGFDDGASRGDPIVDARGIVYREDLYDAGLDQMTRTPDDRIFLRLEYQVP